MKYLLDSDALLALGYFSHSHSADAARFYAATKDKTAFHTSSITELAFVRIGMFAGYFTSIVDAQRALSALKTAGRITLLADDVGADSLPSFVTKAKDTTDGHLLALAHRHGAKLLTFDTGIPGAVLIK